MSGALISQAAIAKEGCILISFQLTKRAEGDNNREYAYRVLRENIMNVWLKPGEALNENELAEAFRMSRTPIHEALIMLRDENLVNVLPQQGSYISLIDLSLLREGYNMRIYIEPHIIRNLAGRVSPKDLKALQRLIYAQQDALSSDCENTNKIHAFFDLDDAFHRAIYSVDNMVNTWDTIKKMSSHFDRVRYLDAMSHEKEYLQHFADEHTHLYKLLLTGLLPDFDLDQFLVGHISSYKKTFFTLCQKYPHYFKDFLGE